jgi:hypothetical protein
MLYFHLVCVISNQSLFIRLSAKMGKWLGPDRTPDFHGRRKPFVNTEPEFRVINTPKPPWVREELLRMKAQMPVASCRFLAATFNRRFNASHWINVGKTHVAETLKQYANEVQVLRTGLKRRPPRPVSMHHIWGLDLTGKTDRQGTTHTLLGMVEHASCANLALSALKDKAVLTLIGLGKNRGSLWRLAFLGGFFEKSARRTCGQDITKKK